ncbi:MAG: TetR/AcrR family transcriptional regulator [Pseudomonadota bacterium]
MARPSLKTQRSHEILAAFAACVARYGLEGATQERVAAEAGVKRTLLRHYLGNRDEMIDALIDHVAADFDAQTEAMLAALPATGRVPALLDLLFDWQRPSDGDRVMTYQALVTAAERLPRAGQAMAAGTEHFAAALRRELAMAHPGAPDEAVTAATLGLMALAFNAEALAPLDLPESWASATRRAADSLVATLEV